MTAKKKKIGLFGFGSVGQGLYDILASSKGFNAEVSKIVIKNADKERTLPAEFFSTDANDILNDPTIDLVVELIDNADDAYHIVTSALKSGKTVISANKKLIAEHFVELVNLQKENNATLLYEASSCASIPIIRTLEEYYDNETLHGVSGIFNGSSNYILSKVQNEGLAYASALKDAQDLGFAESDPALDVGGYDAKYKLVIITGHSYGVFLDPDDVFNYGIQHLSEADVEYARSRNLKIKLVAQVSKVDDGNISLFVTPQFVSPESNLYNVENEYNGVTVEAAFSEKQLFYGKGAGGHPTGSAVLSDISAALYDYRYEYKKAKSIVKYSYSKEVELEVYLRFNNQSILDFIPFTAITEEGKNYVVGTVKLGTLLHVKNTLEQDGAFLVSTGKVKKIETNLSQVSQEAVLV
jgi:homoserine dehydrogenase